MAAMTQQRILAAYRFTLRLSWGTVAGSGGSANPGGGGGGGESGDVPFAGGAAPDVGGESLMLWLAPTCAEISGDVKSRSLTRNPNSVLINAPRHRVLRGRPVATGTVPPKKLA